MIAIRMLFDVFFPHPIGGNTNFFEFPFHVREKVIKLLHPGADGFIGLVREQRFKFKISLLIDLVKG